MTFAGFSIEDWGALTALIAVIAGGILTMFRYIILKPLNDAIKDLGHKISSLGERARHDSRENAQEIDGLGARLTNQDKRLTSLEVWKDTREKYVKNN
ncbi:hypothetical protein [Fructilactobacillus lindneri]|uniref:Uncharacterized protein n=1 Tax=Fructilactobacillus lindneri TaxID=53444 RepID=A0AB33BCZ2_9LACO|nr:hypothetical protein [Fructilactobacillus lindneri]ANZ59356.1 hypothetical protein AYR59_04715 [Fructilactobacillus lindneri]POH04607.1 hypothetical protein BGL33_06870 [Fructilactobacillus lindneri]